MVRYATKAVSCRRQSIFFSQWCTVLRVFHKALHIAHRTSLQAANLRTGAGEVTGSNLDWDTDCHQATSAPKLLAIPPMLHVSSSCQYHSTNATRKFHSQNTSLSLSLSVTPSQIRFVNVPFVTSLQKSNTLQTNYNRFIIYVSRYSEWPRAQSLRRNQVSGHG